MSQDSFNHHHGLMTVLLTTAKPAILNSISSTDVIIVGCVATYSVLPALQTECFYLNSLIPFHLSEYAMAVLHGWGARRG